MPCFTHASSDACYLCFLWFAIFQELNSKKKNKDQPDASDESPDEDELMSEGNEDDGTRKTDVFLHYDFTSRNQELSLPVFNAKKEVSIILPCAERPNGRCKLSASASFIE